VTEGTVTRWLKSVGDEVEVDEPLLEVSTDKVDTEIPSPYAGTLEKILADEDDVVEVGGDLAYIGDGSGSDSEDSAPAAEPAEETGASEEPASTQEPAPAESASGSESSGEGTEVTMPALGESVTEGTVTRWLKDVGEEIEVDEPLLEVSTDKVDTEVPAPAESASGCESSGEGSEVTIPALGESVNEGTVTRWLKDVGGEIEVDDPLREASTHKCDTEVPSRGAGTVQAHLAEEDET